MTKLKQIWSGAIKVSFLYFIISFLYILFSDRILNLFVYDADIMTRIQTYKGWGFVSLSAIYIYYLVHKEIKRKNQVIHILNQSEKWHNLLITNIPDIDVYLFDKELNIILAQGSHMAKLDLASDKIQGKNLMHVHMVPVLHNLMIGNIDQILKGKSVSDDFSYRNEYYELRGVPIINTKEVITACLVVLINLTKQKNVQNALKLAQQQAEQSNKLKTAFIANISHEIRTPLNGILGFTSLLATRTLTSEKINEYSDIINNSSKQLMYIIDEILNISKVETGQMELNIDEVDIEDLFFKVSAFYDPLISQKQIGFNRKFDTQVTGLKIRSDAVKIEQVLHNLLSNAMKFTNSGYIEFACFLEEYQLVFSVTDTGIGIEPDMHEKIFERFRQVDIDLTRAYGGVGLGLPLSRAFIEMLGGNIQVESESNYGSTFTCRFPLTNNKNQNIVTGKTKMKEEH